jgi:hypothetical protein
MGARISVWHGKRELVFRNVVPVHICDGISWQRIVSIRLPGLLQGGLGTVERGMFRFAPSRGLRC